MELFFGGLRNLFFFVYSWLRTLFGIPYDLSAGVLILLAAVLFLWFFSGLAAAQIAERRGVSPRLHLFGGLVLPGLYPLALTVLLKAETGSEEQIEQAKRKDREDRAQAQARLEEEAAREKQADLARENADPGYWTKDRVERVRLRPDGSEAGPLIVILKDGRELAVTRIPGTTPEHAVLEIAGDGGKTASLRIPFVKIESIRPRE